MSAIATLIERLATRPEVEIGQANACWSVRVAAPPRFSTTIDIAPEEVLEWSVVVLDRAGAVVWRDWSDYLGYEKDQDPAAELATMVGEIEWFVDTLTKVQGFRVWSEPAFRILGIAFGRYRVAEWLRNERWQRVVLSDADVDALFPRLVRDRQIA